MATKPPSLADFFPAGKTLDQWKQINNGVGIKVDTEFTATFSGTIAGGTD